MAGKPPLRKLLGTVAAALVVVLLAAVLLVRARLQASLPRLDGEVRVEGLLGPPVAIARDALGVPTIEASDRLDASLALGFLHAQDRFFQMDLLRRAAAGELAALFGRAALPADRETRLHRFRARARAVLAALPEPDRRHLDAYTRGVAAGLADLGAPPFEYVLLRQRPEPWRAEDCLLAVYAMFLELGDPQGSRETSLAVLHDVLPESLAAFLDVPGTEWDAALDGSMSPVRPIPGPGVVDLRRVPSQVGAVTKPRGRAGFRVALEDLAPGSNNWAVAGQRTADGRALLAGDMHLGLSVPNTWYRASLVVPDSTVPDGRRLTTGVTLPGVPAVIAGSNGGVAWAFTNSEVDASDIVVLEMADSTSGTYATPEGPRQLERRIELVAVRGAASETLLVRESIWGPVIRRDHRGRWVVLRWTAHDPEAMNLGLLRMERVRSVDEALALAPTCGIPPQNCVAVDRAGRIGWTIMGRLPRRVGNDGRLPSSWADGTRRWDGHLAPGEVPRIVDPPVGFLWTANQRCVGGQQLARLGDGGYAMAARAHHIREALQALERPTAADMLGLQLDDRAFYLQRWRDLLLAGLTPEVVAADPRRAAMRHLVEDWGGRAAIGSAGYRIVRGFRIALVEQVCAPLVAPCREADPRFNAGMALGQRDGPVWQLLEARPAHLLDPRLADWDDAILAAADTVLGRLAPVESGRPGEGNTAPARAELEEAARTLATRTWGERNTTRIRHPLSGAVPLLGRWLDMPSRPLPGDAFMPRVQSPWSGASQRMVVSPGDEEHGFFHMPCGQSGHPLSPHYRNGHAAWERGDPTPFLPGPPRHRLVLEQAR